MSASWHCAHPGTRPCCPLLPLLCDPAGPDLPGKLCPDRGVPGQPGQSWRFSAAHLHHRDTHTGQPGSAASGASSMGGLSYRVCRWAQADAACPEPAWGASQITFRVLWQDRVCAFQQGPAAAWWLWRSLLHTPCKVPGHIWACVGRHADQTRCVPMKATAPASKPEACLPACLPNPHPARLPASPTLTPSASIP